MYKLIDELLPGCRLIQAPKFEDERGIFVKTWHPDLVPMLDGTFAMREEFYSTSNAGVLRGMHFQVPPHDHGKLVTCLAGKVLDVVVDLRRASPTYGRSAAVELAAGDGCLLYVPNGLAHGFLSLCDGSLLLYKSSCPYSPSHDKGIHWDSFGFAWPRQPGSISERDRRHPALSEFDSPF